MIRGLPVALFALLALVPVRSEAQQNIQERLCDTQFEDCREPLLELIRNETVGIDVAFWFMEDSRYVAELSRRHSAGVPIRILVDQRANASKRLNETILNNLRDARIPMRERYVGDILHFKMMYFHGQNMLEFSKANYMHLSFVPIEPNVNYDDEAIFFTNDTDLTNSFRRRFDDLWTDTTYYRDFANVNGPLVRSCSDCTIHPSMNFPPLEDFLDRSVSRANLEPRAIDAVVFRATDPRTPDAMLRAVARGVSVRLITEPAEYRNPARPWHSKHVDRMYAGGVQIKHRHHAGLAHQASVVMHGLGEVIFGSSNWSAASASGQDEHNFFYHPGLNKPWFFQWFADQFERKWNDTANYVPFQPLPPGAPTYEAPASGALDVPTSSLTLTWEGGTWAHLYDIYFGTTPSPPLLEGNVELGSPVPGYVETWTVTNLEPGTRYYWRIVGRTWAGLTESGPVWSFETAGTKPPAGTLTSPWQTADIGAVGMTGTANATDGVFTVEGAGADIWGTADAFRYVYQAIDGDVDVVARVASIENVHAWVKAGVMIRARLTPDSPHALMLVSPGKGLAFQRRSVTGGISTHTSGGAGTAPAWVKLERRGDSIAASFSFDGSTWTLLGTETYTMGPSLFVGLAVSSHDASTLATAAFDNVTVRRLPVDWQSQDIGDVGIAGEATATGGVFTIRGSGADVWNSADAFHYAWRPLSGDGEIVARVASIENVHAWVKAGVMVREHLTPDSAHAFMLVSPGKGLAFQRRVAVAGVSTHTSGGAGAAPAWVKLERRGNVISAYHSADGVTWILVGNETFTMGTDVYVGVAVSSHDNTRLATAVFDNLAVR